MRKILYLLAFTLLFTSPALAGQSFKVGVTTGSHYNQQRDRWSTWEIRVHVYHDAIILFDDFTYVSSGKGDKKASGLLVENGRPGAANTSRLNERNRMVELLEKIHTWMDTATDKQIKAAKKRGHFTNFRIEIEHDKKKGAALLRMQIVDVSNNREVVLYLNKVQVKRLAALIKSVPEVITEMLHK